MDEKPQLIAGASRAAGAVGLITALLYLGILVGASDGLSLAAWVGWTVLMVMAALLAWFADRVETTLTGRRMLWAAFVIFFVLGVISIFTIGVLFLIASLLCVFSLSRSTGTVGRDKTAGER